MWLLIRYAQMTQLAGEYIKEDALFRVLKAFVVRVRDNLY